MSEQTPPVDDADLGEPVPEIVALREAPTEGFLSRVREGILGRLAGSQVLDFMVNGLLDFMKEVGEFLFGIFDTGGTDAGSATGRSENPGGASERRGEGKGNGGDGNRE
ncbi:MAG: hypothetical protein HKN12_06310 [Gemmatimonadetes bacterium]|nr:hypothetical protein [Gemmatimonadota bacterium]